MDFANFEMQEIPPKRQLGFCKLLRASRSNIALFRWNGRAKSDLFWGSYIEAAFKTMLPTEGGEHFSQKRVKFNRKMWPELCKRRWSSTWHTKCTPEEGHKQEIHTFPMDFANFEVQFVPPRRDFFGQTGGPGGSWFKVSYACNFQNHASHRGREAYFQKNDQK